MSEFDFIPQIEPFVISVGRNSANVTDVWLRGEDALPINQAPARIPFDATLVRIAATGNALETWDVEIYEDAFVRTGGVPSDSNKIAELAMVSTDSDHAAISVDIAEGTEIGVFMRGNSIDSPRVDLYFIRKI